MSTTYLVSTQRLYIRRGLLSKRMQQTRIDRVQNVNTEQSLRDRLLRVGTVDFDTAGHRRQRVPLRRHRQPGRRGRPPSTARSARRRRGLMALERPARGVPDEPRASSRRSILPLATSLDGRQFSFQASLHELDLQAGGYVMLESDGPARLGQIVSLRLERAAGGRRRRHGDRDPARAGRGHDPRRLRPPVPRRDAARGDARRGAGVGAADRAAAGAARGRRADARAGRGARARRRRLRPPHVPVRPVGLGQDVLARADPRAAAGRHRAAARDPRSRTRTTCGSGTVREGADPELAARYREVAGGVEVHSAAPGADQRLRLALRELETDAQAAAAAARPDRRSRRVRRAGRAARGRSSRRRSRR